MNDAERKKLLDDMDSAAYECAGVLAGIVDLLSFGFPLSTKTFEEAKRDVMRLHVLISAYRAENAIDNAKEKA